MVKMKAITDDLKQDYDLAINCPEKVTKEQAYVDQMKEGEKLGLMDCFCLDLLKKDPVQVYPKSNKNVLFSEFKTYMDDQTPYCFDWFTNYT